MSAICHDHGDHEISERHGAWWFTCWIPLGRRALYLAASTGPRFTPHVNRRSFSTKRLCVSLPPFRESKPRVIVHRWCAHLDVSYEAAA